MAYIPIDIDAERALLAALLTSPQAFYDAEEVLGPDDFGHPPHHAVWKAICALEAVGTPVDAVTVADEMRRAKTLKLVGGVTGLEELVADAHKSINTKAHSQIVADKAKLRRVISASRVMASAAGAPDAVADEVEQLAEELVFDLGATKRQGTLLTMNEVVPQLLIELAKGKTRQLLGHSTGFAELDRLTAGFQPGQLIIIAARPAMGKSALALQMARHIAETTGGTVPFLSYEMSSMELSFRMLASAAEVGLGDLRHGMLAPGKDRDVAIHAEKMSQLSLLIDDNPPATISGVRSQMRRLARRSDVSAIFVDYLQLMDGDHSRTSNRVEEVSAVSRGLKRLAAELGVPIVALSQLNRSLEQRSGKRPMLSDLRESGSLEQDANLVLFVYRDSVYNMTADPNDAELIIAKQRSGPSGMSVKVTFKGEYAKFVDVPTSAVTTPRTPSTGPSPF